jgi:hypothetical protein
MSGAPPDRSTVHHHGQVLRGVELRQQRAAAVAGDDDEAVEVAAEGAADHAPAVVLLARHQQRQRQVGLGEALRAAADDRREVGVLEELLLRLAEHQTHAARTAGHQAARARVAHVPGRAQRSQHLLARSGLT